MTRLTREGHRSRPRRVDSWWLLAALVGIVGALIAGLVATPEAVAEPPQMTGADAIVRLDDAVSEVYVPPAPRPRSVSATDATINVSYSGFSADARAAFQFAVDIWSKKISSNVPIQISASWTSLGSGSTLGSAGAATYFRDLPNEPLANSWYPSALANKLAGRDLNQSTSDVVARFNSEYPNWYFGTDGRPGPDRVDFVTVVLHELGHGLGFIGSMRVDNGIGCFGSFTGCPVGGTVYPFAFDRLAVNSAGAALFSSYPINSRALADQLTGQSVFWNGQRATSATGTRPQLYAPAEWDQGSSYAHLDEDRYPAGNANSLMTPFVRRGEAIHDPGPITLALFADLGWETTLVPTPTPSKQLQTSNVLLRFPTPRRG